MTTLNRAHVVSSGIVAVGGAVSVDANNDIRPDMPNFTASIRYYSDSDGTPVVPGAGTVTITATGLASGQDTSIANGALDSTDVTNYVDWKHHCTKVTATPAGVTIATHYQLFVVQEP